MKIAYDLSCSAFGLSQKGLDLYNKKRTEAGLSTVADNFDLREKDRHDPHLIEVIEELGAEANDWSHLKIKEAPRSYEKFYTVKTLQGGKERVIFKPVKLMKERLNGRNIDELTEEECRTLLKDLYQF